MTTASPVRASADVPVTDLKVVHVNAAAFAPFGTLIEKTPDGKPFGADEAHLVLDRGMPRFYILDLKHRELAFRVITRHIAVTQCLASVGGQPWLIAVAPPDEPDNPDARPDPAKIRAFRIEGHQAIMLGRGTWHAGPFFEAPEVGFFNLELADTNQTDHHNCMLDREFGLRYRFVT
jgi:ureidoglycolate hydrolase